ncbi:diaminopimelate decarboxylase [Chloroflexota bacterium]
MMCEVKMNNGQDIPRLSLFPLTAEVNEAGHLFIGGCDTVELADKFGTPLYVFDEASLRRKCAEFRTEFQKRYADTAVAYAGKAFLNKGLVNLLREEGLGLDAVSAGELSMAHSVDFPMAQVYFNGNNKSAEELKLALEWQVGRIVVDNFRELDTLNEIAGVKGYTQDVLLRFSPGIDPHTHKYVATGIVDSKFGFLLSTWEEAVSKAMSAPNLNLVGLHFHLGSLIFEFEPYQEAIGVVLDFAARAKQKHNFELRELNIGGGFAVQYTVDAPSPPVSAYAEKITLLMKKKCAELKLALPRLILEPGRFITGQAGVALYTVGSIKDIPGIRRYVSVDGGMADNIRPALYGSRYEALVANRAAEKNTDKVTISGKFCESGDVLISDIKLPPLASGDVVAISDCGAYCLSMASNYNASLKPAVVMVKDGKARLIRRRETFEDLTRCDLI